MSSLFDAFFPFLGTLLVGFGLVWLGGCDTVPGLEPHERRSPSVFALRIDPDSVHGGDLSAEGTQDTVALHLAAKATDPDGAVDRVLFTVEPASSPRGTAFGQLRPVEGTPHGYARNLAFLIPETVDEIYTVRVFAVDDDSLTSNQVTGQFRYVPAGSSSTDTDGPSWRSAGDPGLGPASSLAPSTPRD